MAAFLTPFMGAAVNVALPRIGGEFRMNAIALGWVATSYILAAAIGLVPLGRLSDRLEPRIVASIGMGLTVVGLVSFTFLGAGTPLGLIVAGLVLFGAGFGLFSSPNTNAIIGSVEPRSYGIAAGMGATMRMVGQMFSMGIVMLLLALLVGRLQITSSQHAGLLPAMKVAFAVFAALCLGGVFASLARGKLHGAERIGH
jgi:MFS family permease